MTLEHDLERLGRADLDLEELPIAQPDEPEEQAPQPRRRGRPPGTWKPGRQAVQAPARVAALKERMAAIKAKAREATAPVGPNEPPPTAPPVEEPVGQAAISEPPVSEPVSDEGPPISTEQPGEPAQESTVNEEQAQHEWMSRDEALQVVGCTLTTLERLVESHGIEVAKGAAPARGGRHMRIFRADQVRAAAAAYASRPRGGQPQKAQAPERAAQPEAKVKTKPKPRSEPPSPAAAAAVPVEGRLSVVQQGLQDLVGALQDLVVARAISQSKADRVLAVLLEG